MKGDKKKEGGKRTQRGAWCVVLKRNWQKNSLKKWRRDEGFEKKRPQNSKKKEGVLKKKEACLWRFFAQSFLISLLRVNRFFSFDEFGHTIHRSLMGYVKEMVPNFWFWKPFLHFFLSTLIIWRAFFFRALFYPFPYFLCGFFSPDFI